jgi:MFS family permease
MAFYRDDTAAVGRRRRTFAVLTLGVTAYSLMQAMVFPVLANIQSSYHTTAAAATWTLTGYLLSASVFTPILGRVGDVVGKQRMFVAALLALGAGSLIAALATSIGVLILGRVVQGIGGGVLPLSFGIIRDEFPAATVSHYVGLIGTVGAVGGSAGTVVAGPIVEHLNLHWLFWIPLIVIVIAAVASALFIPESPVRASGRIAVLPAVLVSAWLVAFLLALSQAPDWGWGSPRVIGLILAAVVLAYGWVRAELRAPAPLIDMQMMRVPAVWTTNLVSLLLGLAFYSAVGFIPQLMQVPTTSGYGLGQTVVGASLIMAPAGILTFAAGQASSALTRRFGSRTLIVAGGALSGAALTLAAVEHAHVWLMYLWTGLMGAGLGLSFAAMSAVVVAAVPPEQTGVASGMNANIRTVGGSVGSALTATLLLELPGERGWVVSFLILGAGFFASAAAGLLIPINRRSIPAEAAPHPALAIVPGGTVVGSDPE